MLPSTEFSALCCENHAAMTGFGWGGLAAQCSLASMGGLSVVPGVAMGTLLPCAALGWGWLQPGSVQR